MHKWTIVHKEWQYQKLASATLHYDRYPQGLISGSQQKEDWSAEAKVSNRWQ